MRFKFLIVSILFTPYFSNSQDYEVLESKKVSRQNASKVRKGDFISRDDTLFISEKGHITLDVESTMHLRLGPGKYAIRKEAKRHNAWYAKHLELTNYLKRRDLISCKFRYKTMVVPGSDRHYEMDRIELDQKGLVRIESESDSLSIKWHNPQLKYEGGYLVIIRDFYNNGFIDVIETKGNSITLFPAKYGHRHMFYNVMAENCRSSLRYKLEVLTVEPSSLHRTNYLVPDQ